MTTKTCGNCAYKLGDGAFAKCERTGFTCSVEMMHGGRCAGPKTGIPEMNLWEPRRTIWFHIKRVLKVDQ